MRVSLPLSNRAGVSGQREIKHQDRHVVGPNQWHQERTNHQPTKVSPGWPGAIIAVASSEGNHHECRHHDGR